MTRLGDDKKLRRGGRYGRVMGTLWRSPKREKCGRAAMGLLLDIWSYCADQQSSVVTEAGMRKLIAGDPNGRRQLRELVESRFVDVVDGGYAPHNWRKHSGSVWDEMQARRKCDGIGDEGVMNAPSETIEKSTLPRARALSHIPDPLREEAVLPPAAPVVQELALEPPAAPKPAARKPRAANPDLVTFRRVLAEEGERLGLVEVVLSKRMTELVLRKVRQHADRAHGGSFEAAAREIAASALADTSKPPHYALQDWQPRKLVPLRSSRIEAFGGSQPSDWAGGPSVAEQMAQAKAEAERRAQKRAEMFGRVANG